tara:strand:+ start:458 stop:3403 length:2946 start_codon:yes stop_codon:yes gene_type:complete
MGGVAGHMYHLYENPDLTFEELEDIFIKSSQGSLIGTEKTDGQNIFLSYSDKDERAKAARNMGNIKTGGMTGPELADKFGGRGDLEKSFTESFAAFEKAVDLLSPEAVRDIFGPDANVWYNAEVQDPRTSNVINYDSPALTIHRVGHKEFDKQSKKWLDKDLSSNAKKLEDALESVENFVYKTGDYSVKMNAIRNLQALGDDEALNLTLSRMYLLMKQEGLSKNSTISEFINKRVTRVLDSALPDLDDSIKKEIMKRIFKVKGSSLTKIYKILPEDSDDLKTQVKKVVNMGPRIVKEAVWPLEDVVHDFSVEMLKSLESTFVIDNKAEVKRLRSEISKAIDAIEASGNEKAMEVLSQQMRKLKDKENVSSAAEGFVFDYNGVTYKFTGNFAPINQLLGIFRYGRGDIPAMELKEEEGDVEDEPNSGNADVALIPGSFKPPHLGHFELAKSYLQDANKVVFLVSDPQKYENIRFIELPKYNAKIEVTPDAVKRILDLYINNAKLKNRIEVWDIWNDGFNNPLGFTHDYLKKIADSGDEHKVVLGVSSKDTKDLERFKDMKTAYEKGSSNLELTDSPREPLGAISATDFRNAVAVALEDKDYSELEKFIPNGISPEQIINIILEESNMHFDDKRLGEVVVGVNAPDEGKFRAYKGKELRASEMFDFILNEPNKDLVNSFVDKADSMDEKDIQDFLDDWARSKVREASTMATGAVAGNSGDNNDESLIREEEPHGMNTINRKQFIEELSLREAVRNIIKKAQLHEQEKETEVRNVIKKMISEDLSNSPYASTGINELEQLLKKIVPVIEPDYKSLTTDENQRASYRAHIITAVKNALSPGVQDPNAGIEIIDTPDEDDLGLKEVEVDEEVEMTIHNDEKFIDIDGEAEEIDPEQEKENEFSVEGEDETGRNFAMGTWERIETNIVDSYRKLSNPSDRDLFYDYLVANLKLYFDKFDDELRNVLDEPQSDVYDQEKGSQEDELGL